MNGPEALRLRKTLYPTAPLAAFHCTWTNSVAFEGADSKLIAPSAHLHEIRILSNPKCRETLRSLCCKETQTLAGGYGDWEYPRRRWRRTSRNGVGYHETDHELRDVLVQIVGDDIDECRPVGQKRAIECEGRRDRVCD